ncbi:MAG TPA: TIGR03936 family radical SAM-associated protein, partial [Candidatus Eisenbacteria bacterium]|nr:TIGR03936 family radical SAM-associated protein [Candidatus Eisenbacteria bacterium]
LPEMLLRLADLRERGATRGEILREIAGIEGFYVPSLYATEIDDRTGFLVVGEPVETGVPVRVRRAVVEDLKRFPFPDDAPVAAAEAIFDRMAIEIARGCTEGCRFCQAGVIYRPVRERDPEEIVETIVSATRKGGYDEVGLTTLSTADYSCISPLIKKVMERLRPEKTSLSVASLRAYGLDEDLFDEIKSVRATGLTFAPEAGTQRMRDVISKNISEEDMARTAHRVFSRGWRRAKLYFMIGLPTEMDEDVVGIMETGRRMKDIGAEYHARGAVGITVSVSSHVPKPHTPFQWCAMDALEEIERKQDLLGGLARRYRLEFRRHDPRASYLECVLGRGDRRLADVIEMAWRAGARFDSWDDQLRWGAWVDAMAAHPEIPYDLFLGTLPVDARLPWDHLDMRLEPRFLATEYKRAMRGKLSPPCGKPVGTQVHHTNLTEHAADKRILVCYHCGVACDMTRMREERGEFLEKLEAFEPGARILGSLAAVETTEATPGADRQNGNGKAPHRQNGNGRAPHRFEQGEPRRYRLRYEKTGVAALTGHLDFIRALPRVLRRAGLMPYYSEGYHPKPVMEFSPPLPLGMNGYEELVEINLVEEIDPTMLVERLNVAAPEGLRFIEAQRRLPGSPRLSKDLASAEYLVRIDTIRDDLDTIPDRYLARESDVQVVNRKNSDKTVDLRSAVADMRWMDHDHVPEGFVQNGSRYLWMRLPLNQGVHARPQEVAAAALGDPVAVDLTRLARFRFGLR